MNFHIFGAGPLAYIVKNLEKKFSNVIYSSYVDEEKLIEAFQSAHVFVSPSRFETFLLTSLEAQSAGTPVIASDIAGPRETVISGQTGLLVNATQYEIINAILYFKIFGTIENKSILIIAKMPEEMLLDLIGKL